MLCVLIQKIVHRGTKDWLLPLGFWARNTIPLDSHTNNELESDEDFCLIKHATLMTKKPGRDTGDDETLPESDILIIF